jgi:hypothetical protein
MRLQCPILIIPSLVNLSDHQDRNSRPVFTGSTSKGGRSTYIVDKNLAAKQMPLA